MPDDKRLKNFVIERDGAASLTAFKYTVILIGSPALTFYISGNANLALIVFGVCLLGSAQSFARFTLVARAEKTRIKDEIELEIPKENRS